VSCLIHRVAPARSGTPPHPGLLLLHGRGADENDLLPLAEELDPRLITVAARGPLQFRYGGYHWYDLDERRGVGFPDAASLQEALNLLEWFIEEITAEYPIDPEGLYAGGFSMGAVMSATLSLTAPDRISGAAILSGYLPPEPPVPFQPERAAGHPFFVGHGVYDPVIPVAFGRATREYLQQTEVDLTYREYPVPHAIGPTELLDLSQWITGALDAREVARPA
jgi:phospholipase/carboxylesterase